MYSPASKYSIVDDRYSYWLVLDIWGYFCNKQKLYLNGELFSYSTKSIKQTKKRMVYATCSMLCNLSLFSSCLKQRIFMLILQCAGAKKAHAVSVSLSIWNNTQSGPELPHKSVVAINVRRAESAGGIKCTPFRPRKHCGRVSHT